MFDYSKCGEWDLFFWVEISKLYFEGWIKFGLSV